MRRTVVSALTAAFFIGAASTTFAAADPFSDVPQNHWAYGAVSRLQEAGIISGYGDGTFRGGQNITRYEMAQMVVNAMVYIAEYDKRLAENPEMVKGASLSADEKNLSSHERRLRNMRVDLQARTDIDRLANEFREEIDDLGVRISNLEKHSDMVQWTGEVRYNYLHDKTAGARDNLSRMQLRLFPTVQITDNWAAKARLTANVDMKSDDSSDAELTFVYAEGKYDKLTLEFGKMPLFSHADQGIVADDFFSGGRFTYNINENFDAKFEAGRWSGYSSDTDSASDYVGAELMYDNGDGIEGGVAYRRFKLDDGKANIFSLGGGYQLTDDVQINAALAHNSRADAHKNAYNIELDYLGTDESIPKSWGAFVAYRYIGEEVGLCPTFDSFERTGGKKGFDIGGGYVPYKNTLAEISYFYGKSLKGGTNKVLFTRASWFF